MICRELISLWPFWNRMLSVGSHKLVVLSYFSREGFGSLG